MRRLLTLSSELFQVPLDGLRALCANRRFRLAAILVPALLLSACVIIAAALQFWLFPRINDYRDDLAARAGNALGVAIEVGHLHGEWSNLHPRFVLDDVVVFDAAHRPALQLSQIGATLSWWQLLIGHLEFRNLTVVAPVLDFKRDKQGRLFLADLPLDGGGDFRVDSLLEQGEMVLTSEQLTWTDALRDSPPLALRDVDFRLRSNGARHRLDLSFTPPEALGAPFKGRIDWIGRSFADWHQWKSSVTLKINFIDLAGWRAWVDYPVKLNQGRGKLNLKLEATGLDLTHAEGTLALTDLKIRLAPDLDELVLQQARTQLLFQKRNEGQMTQLALNDFAFTDGQGKSEPESDLFIERQRLGANPGEDDRLQFRASQMDLARLRSLAVHLPIPKDIRQTLTKTQPSGVLEGVKATIQLKNDRLAAYDAQAAFKGLSVRSEDGAHFVRQLTGKIDLNQTKGQLTLNSSDAMLASPGILPINEVPLTQLSGKISWQRDADKLGVKVKSLQLRNDDLQAAVNGTWSGSLAENASERERAGDIDMKIVFDYAKTDSGWKYVPLSASPDISTWIKGAISDGAISDFRIEMAGPVWDMPYGSPEPGSPPGSSEATGVEGKFTLGFKTSDLTVKYADGYPALKKLDATFTMNQNKIRIIANDGMIDEMRFSSIKADMADVSAFENHLLISGQAQGPTESAIRYLKDTPVAGHIHHFADTLSAHGKGKLDLAVDLNLAKASDIKIQGRYDFMDNQVMLAPGTPPVSALKGSIRFTESAMDSTDLQAQWSGEPLSVRISTNEQGTQIDASGRVSVSELRQHYDLPVFDQLSGKTHWQARVTIRGGQADLSLSSDLKGIAASLPDPFNKSAGAALPLTVVRQTATGRSGVGIDQIWRISLGNALAGNLGLNSKGQVLRGRVILGSGQVPAMSDQPGIQLEALRSFNVDYWAKAFGAGTGASMGTTKSRNVGVVPTTWTLKAPTVTAFGRRFQDFRATVQSAADHTTVQMASKELQGDLDWYPLGKGEGGERGLLQGRLSRLDLTAATDTQASSSKDARSEIESLPDLSFRVDELFWQGKPWGRLTFRARNQKSDSGQSWRIDPVQLDGPDLKFSGRLNWVSRLSAASRKSSQENMTALDFKMNSPQIGNLLAKLGYPGTVKRGSAQMEGQVSWPANPFGFDPGTLSGNFKMSAKNGQFAKMDPGVGRLLGLLSLQSIPQRLTLDFRDIFSEGLAFESIDGRFDIRDGLMKTSDLEMNAPAARVLMRGETNLAKQTQDVRVVVQPALSNSVALGVTVLNPIVGAAAFVTQKVLGDPLSKLFAYQYHITGSWSDPQVDKESVVGSAAKPADSTEPPAGALSAPASAPTPVAPVPAPSVTGSKP